MACVSREQNREWELLSPKLSIQERGHAPAAGEERPLGDGDHRVHQPVGCCRRLAARLDAQLRGAVVVGHWKGQVRVRIKKGLHG